MSEQIKDIDAGYICPCCQQYCKRYRRALNSSMAAVIVLIHKSNKTDYFHVENWLKEIGKPQLRADFHKLTFWGLLEKKVGKRDDGSNRNGFYKITGRGIAFASGTFKVQEKAVILNNKFQFFEGEEIDVLKALRNKFSYDELMGKSMTIKPKTITPPSVKPPKTSGQNFLF